jgi:hypothetical protein
LSKPTVDSSSAGGTSRKRSGSVMHLLRTLTAELENEQQQQQVVQEDVKFHLTDVQADQSDGRNSPAADNNAAKAISSGNLEGGSKRLSLPMSVSEMLKTLNTYKALQVLLFNISASPASTVAPLKSSALTSLGQLSTWSPSNQTTTTMQSVYAPSSSTQQTFNAPSSSPAIVASTVAAQKTSEAGGSSYNCCNSSSLNADVIASKNELRKIRTDVARLTVDVRDLRNRTAYLLLANQTNYISNMKSAVNYREYDNALTLLNSDLNLTKSSLEADIRAVEERLALLLRNFEEIKNSSLERYEQRVDDVEKRLSKVLEQLRTEVNGTLKQAFDAFLANISTTQIGPKDSINKPKGELTQY